MGGLLLFEGEELVIRFRPHPASYLRRYLAALLWLVPAGVAAWWPTAFPGARAIEWGLIAFGGVALAGAFLAKKLFRTGFAFTWFALLCVAATVFARLMDGLAFAYPDWFLAILLGTFLAIVRIITHEADRIGRLHFLTTERLVIRGGLKSRHDRTIGLKKIVEVRADRPISGRFFDFGDLHLVTAKSVRGKEQKLYEEVESLRGIGRLNEVQYQVEQLVEESRMGTKDRRRRLEERRVKDSMRRLAAWMRRGSRSPRH